MPKKAKLAKNRNPDNAEDDSESITSDEFSSLEQDLEKEHDNKIISIQEKKLMLAREYIDKYNLEEQYVGITKVDDRTDATKVNFEKTEIISSTFALNMEYDFISFKHEPLTCVVYDDHNNNIYVATKKNNIYVVNINTKKRLKFPKHSNGTINALCLCLNQTHIASAGSDKKIYIWNLQNYSGGPMFTLSGHTKAIYSLAHENNILYSVGEDKLLLSWNLKHQSRIQIDVGHINKIRCVECVTSKLVLTGGDDNTLRYWNIEQNKHAIIEANNCVDTIAVINKYGFMSAGCSNKVQLYSIAKRKPITEYVFASNCWVNFISVIKNTDVAFICTSLGQIEAVQVSMGNNSSINKLDSIQLDGIIVNGYICKEHRLFLVTLSNENKYDRIITSKNKTGIAIIRYEHT